MRALLIAIVIATAVPVGAGNVLFDYTKDEAAGNADWIVDDDMPVPQPPQSGIGSTTPESYWLGANSAWGVRLVQLGHTVHSLTDAYGVSYGNGGNPYDLQNYDLYVVVEPQDSFEVAEKGAVLAYLGAGGNLIAVANHNASDRNGNGWDSPRVFNDMLEPTCGVHFHITGDPYNSISHVSDNENTDPFDPITRGPEGDVYQFSYNSGTVMTLDPSANPTVAGHVWHNSGGGNSLVMIASVSVGSGRVVLIGDSSPEDDGTGRPGNILYPNWYDYDNGTAVTNASIWLLSGTDVPDQEARLPESPRIISVHPNPANPSVTVEFVLSGPSDIRLDAFDVLGRHVATLTDSVYPAGAHRVTWSDTTIPSGVYLVRLQAGDTIVVDRAVLIR
jgi:hypothetical protein